MIKTILLPIALSHVEDNNQNKILHNHPLYTEASNNQLVYDERLLEPPVALRWDFTTCGQTGRIGPSVEQCERAYFDTNNEQVVTLDYGVQHWNVPADGLYLITAKGASGRALGPIGGGRGAILTGNFHLQKHETLQILVGQQSDFDISSYNRGATNVGIGGSGGTFVVRESDGRILLAAGGGGSGAGRAFNTRSPGHADATAQSANGRNGSFTSDDSMAGYGGVAGHGGRSGIGLYGGGAGAGFLSHGESAVTNSETRNLNIEPRGAMMFLAKGRDKNNGPGVGGKMMIQTARGDFIENNGGFGGGGSGGFRGTAGGGGGFSGGGGGTEDGFSGGGGSLNNGQRPVNMVDHIGPGEVTITFIGKQCCGPVDVYIAMSFIAGILVKLILTYMAYCSYRAAQRWHTRQIIENHLKKVGKKSDVQKVCDKIQFH